jgi:hypothetical protein
MKAMITKAALALTVLAGSVGYAAAQDYRYDRDGDRYYNRDYDSYNRYYDRDDYYRRGIHVARENGYRDGADMAREDMWKGKRFNPKPRGRYDDKDNGYRREFGSKYDYRRTYERAYYRGYENTFRQGYYRRGW